MSIQVSLCTCKHHTPKNAQNQDKAHDWNAKDHVNTVNVIGWEINKNNVCIFRSNSELEEIGRYNMVPVLKKNVHSSPQFTLPLHLL